MTPVAVTIAGSDPSGGAGIQADLKTFSALGVYGASVITALTAQNTRGVQGIHPIPPAFITQQIDSVFSDLAVGAVKIGMLGQAEAIAAIADALARHGTGPVVLDPVMVATSGDRLLAPKAVGLLRRVLIPNVLVVTHNLPEAAALLAEPVAADEGAMRAQAERILALGPGAVLIKGGHAHGPESVDLLVDRSGSVQRFAAPPGLNGLDQNPAAVRLRVLRRRGGCHEQYAGQEAWAHIPSGCEHFSPIPLRSGETATLPAAP